MRSEGNHHGGADFAESGAGWFYCVGIGVDPGGIVESWILRVEIGCRTPQLGGIGIGGYGGIVSSWTHHVGIGFGIFPFDGIEVGLGVIASS